VEFAMKQLKMAWACMCIALTACSGGGDGGAGGGVTPPPAGPRAEVESGTIEGLAASGADGFLGIPFAAPPVGDLRFRPPRDPAPFVGVRETKAFSPACRQPAEVTGSEQPPPGAEDCLYLNVWTPSDRGSGQRLPVMVFLHGGANLTGSAADPLDIVLNTSGAGAFYDGALMSARGGSVVVTINYRLGAFGFLAHESLVADGATNSAGNYGLMDQIAALQWVRRNISAFGGDPARVTLFGQSAGAYDVCTLLASPRAAGLFHRAAMHSGSCAIHTRATARANAEVLVAELGCAGDPNIPACLRRVPETRLATARSVLPQGLGSFRMFPSVDGYIVGDMPLNIIRSGRHNVMPLLIGSTSAEYLHRFSGIPSAQYAAAIEGIVGPARRDAVLALYPLSDFANADAAVAAVASDRNITCPTRLYAETFSRAQSQRVFRYHFRRTLTTPARKAPGAYHTSDLLYLFQRMDGRWFSATSDDRAVEQTMLRHWAAFAASGDPNAAGLAAWPSYVPDTDPYLAIDVVSAAGERLAQTQCDFWLGGELGEVVPGSTVRIGAGATAFSDPEVLSARSLLSYQTETGEIRLAALEPTSGLFDPAAAVVVDRGAFPLLDSYNGPEFGLDAEGWSLVYTKAVNGTPQTWRAQPRADGGLSVAPLTAGTSHMTALANKAVNFSDTLVLNIRGNWAAGELTWFDDRSPDRQTAFELVDTRDTTHPRWIHDTRILVSRYATGPQRGQLYLLDTATGGSRQITNDAGDKTFAFGWIAPDFGNQVRVLALVDKRTIGVYGDTGGAFWTRIGTLAIPEASGGITVGSAEPFVANGKSYMTLSIQTNVASAPPQADAQIWVFGAHPAQPFAMRCDDGGTGPVMRIDPESFVGADQVFVFYNIVRAGGAVELYRCATGIPTR
jgi:para-nitrobenzyl esterase